MYNVLKQNKYNAYKEKTCKLLCNQHHPLKLNLKTATEGTLYF